MDIAGVDGAIPVSPYSMYRYDASYALEARAARPGRFGLVCPFDPGAEDVAEEVTQWARTEGVVAARIMLPDPFAVQANDPGLNRILAAGAATGLTVNVLCWGNVPLLGGLAERNPDASIVLDHLGLRQPFEPPPPPDAFADLPKVLALAQYDNFASSPQAAFDAEGVEDAPWRIPDVVERKRLVGQRAGAGDLEPTGPGPWRW